MKRIMKMNKEFLESLANYLEKFISNEVEKRCKKLEDERNAAEWNSQRYKRWLLFLIKDNSINLDKLYEEAEKNPVNGKKVTLITVYLVCQKRDWKLTIGHTHINVSKNSKNFMRTHNASSSHSFYLRRPSSKSSTERRLTRQKKFLTKSLFYAIIWLR